MEELEAKVTLGLEGIRKTKVYATISLTYEEWIAFRNSQVKSGNNLGRSIVNQVAPALEKIERAIEILKA